MYKAFRLCSNSNSVNLCSNSTSVNPGILDPVFTCDPMDFDEINRQAIEFLTKHHEEFVDIYVNGSATYLAELVRLAALFMAEEHLENGRGVCVMRAWHPGYDFNSHKICWRKQFLL